MSFSGAATSTFAEAVCGPQSLLPRNVSRFVASRFLRMVGRSGQATPNGCRQVSCARAGRWQVANARKTPVFAFLRGRSGPDEEVAAVSWRALPGETAPLQGEGGMVWITRHNCTATIACTCRLPSPSPGPRLFEALLSVLSMHMRMFSAGRAPLGAQPREGRDQALPQTTTRLLHNSMQPCL